MTDSGDFGPRGQLVILNVERVNSSELASAKELSEEEGSVKEDLEKKLLNAHQEMTVQVKNCFIIVLILIGEIIVLENRSKEIKLLFIIGTLTTWAAKTLIPELYRKHARIFLSLG